MSFAVSSSFEAGNLCANHLPEVNDEHFLLQRVILYVIQHKFCRDSIGNLEVFVDAESTSREVAILFISLNPPRNCRSVDSQVFTD